MKKHCPVCGETFFVYLKLIAHSEDEHDVYKCIKCQILFVVIPAEEEPKQGNGKAA